MKQIIIFTLIISFTIGCMNKEKEKKSSFSVEENSEPNLIPNKNEQASDNFIGVRPNSNPLEIAPSEVLFTYSSDHRLTAVFKVTYDGKYRNFNKVGTYYNRDYDYYNDEDNQWSYNYMPGFHASHGKNIVNISHFNTKDHTTNLFFEKSVLINTLYFPALLPDTINNKIVERDFYLVSVYDEDTNKDGYINWYDLRRFYYFDIDGKNQTLLVPKNQNVESSMYDIENDYMYIYTRLDKNKNGSLDINEEKHIFWIDLKDPKNNGLLF